MALFETLVAAVSPVIAHECIQEHKEDIRKVVDDTVKTASQVCEEGWQRDRDSGGISSWGKESETATA
ncbi:MAG: hypothetical protein RSE13_11650 [Planktothrix sp. GU0601_MAG3]|nr:MAG: hypothetical protein RSE13_11650 [Planktothrix sp. GU0601_MAG3]